MQAFTGAFLLLCAATDWHSRKIPNFLLAAGLVMGLALRAAEGMCSGLIAVFECTVVLCMLFPLFLCRLTGAGDIKLAAVLAGMAGVKATCLIIAAGLVAAVPVCIVKLLVRRNLNMRLFLFFAYIRQVILTKQVTAYYDPERDGYGDTIPFAVFMFLGYLYYIHTGGQI